MVSETLSQNTLDSKRTIVFSHQYPNGHSKDQFMFELFSAPSRHTFSVELVS